MQNPRPFITLLALLVLWQASPARAAAPPPKTALASVHKKAAAVSAAKAVTAPAPRKATAARLPPPMNPDELLSIRIRHPDHAPAPVQLAKLPAKPATHPVASAPKTAGVDACTPLPPDDDAQAGDEDDEDDGEPDTAAPTAAPPPSAKPDHLYSADISDAELAKLWKSDRSKLGSISVGFVNSGRIFNSVKLPDKGPWAITVPQKVWGTKATIGFLETVFNYMKKRFPDEPPPRVNGISVKDGGYVRPHHAHQNGRDVDIGFYYRDGDGVPHTWYRGTYMDLAENWAMIRAFVTMTDVQFILVDRRIKKLLYNYALSIGEDKGWLDSVFNGPQPLIRHARHHRDHFHVQFYNGRAQELGRRIMPLLAKDPHAKHIVTHRLRFGDTLSQLARRYGTTVRIIMRANGLRTTRLRAGRYLAIPLRGPCTNCPVPPPVIVPPRHLPPTQTQARIG